MTDYLCPACGRVVIDATVDRLPDLCPDCAALEAAPPRPDHFAAALLRNVDGTVAAIDDYIRQCDAGGIEPNMNYVSFRHRLSVAAASFRDDAALT